MEFMDITYSYKIDLWLFCIKSVKCNLIINKIHIHIPYCILYTNIFMYVYIFLYTQI